jgi:hypothetical protein
MRFDSNRSLYSRMILLIVLAFAALDASATTKILTASALQVTALPMGQVGVAYAAALNVNGGTAPYTWTGSGLPAGLALNSNGMITGTPTASTNGLVASFTATVKDSSSPSLSITSSFGILISAAINPVKITSLTLPSGTAGTAYTAQLTAAGGTAPYTFKLGKDTTLPDGLSMSATGAISGTPTQSNGASGSAFSVYVIDSSSPAQYADASVNIMIAPAPTGLRIDPRNLPGATVGIAYADQLNAKGGSAPYTFALASGSALPAGLTLSSTGVLSGMPTVASPGSGPNAFSVVVTDSSATPLKATVALTLQVSQGLTITSTTLPAATSGTAYSAQLTVTGGAAPYSWVVAHGVSMPAGLSISSSGLIAGTPTTTTSASGFTFNVYAMDSSATQLYTNANVTLVIKASASGISIDPRTLPNAVTGAAYTDQLVAKGGNAPYTFALASGSTLPAGLALSASGVLSGTPTTASPNGSPNTFNVKVTDSSTAALTGIFAMSLQIAQGLTISTSKLPVGTVGSPYSAQLSVTGGVAPYKWVLAHGVSMPAGLSISSTGLLAGTPTAATAANGFTFSIYAEDSSTTPLVTSVNLTLVIDAAANLTISGYNAPAGTVGTPYAFTFQAMGGTAPYSWSVTNLIAGLTMSSSGVVSGTPTVSGAITAVVVVKDSSNPALTASMNIPIQINPASNPVTITSVTLPPAYVGAAYVFQLTATGGKAPYSWKLAKSITLPAGLSLSATGILSGTPTTVPASSPVALGIVVQDSSSPSNGADNNLMLNLYAAVAECTNNGSGNAILSGQYAMTMNGYDSVSESRFNLVGNWTADGNGNISSGGDDLNSPTWTAPTNSTFSGTYSIGSDNRGTMTLTAGGQSNTFCFVADALSSSGIATGGYILRADASGQNAAGTFQLQNPAAFTAATLKGNYVFGLQGNSISQAGNGAYLRMAVAGVLSFDGAGNVSSGEADMSQQKYNSENQLENQYESKVALTGTYTVASNGRGTLQLNTGGGSPVHFVFEIISGNELRLMQDDDSDVQNNCCNSVLAGRALLQTAATFSNATLSGSGVFIKNAIVSTGALNPGRDIEAGILRFDGNGNLNGVSDENSAGTVTTANQITAAYSVDAQGRVTITTSNSSGSAPTLYLSGANQGFGVIADPSIGLVELDAQTVPANSFSVSGFAGSFGLGEIWQGPNAPTQTGSIAVDTSGAVSGAFDSDNNGAITTDLAQTATLAGTDGGRFLLTPTGSSEARAAVYLVSNTKAYMIDISGSNNAPLQVLVHQ